MLYTLEQYYKMRTNGEWEHFYGFTLESCDNPGWLINIKDPDLFKCVCYLVRENMIPQSIDYQIRCAELSEVVLFSPELSSLSEFVVQVINMTTRNTHSN